MQYTTAPTPNEPDTRPLTAGVVGASGYAGQELIRILTAHPSLRPAVLQARSEGFDDIDADALSECDVVFLALPHGESRALGDDRALHFRVGGASAAGHR